MGLFSGFGDLIFAWQLILAAILIGWVYNKFGPGMLTAGISIFLVWAFVLNNWGLFSIVYLVIFFFMMQGLFFIQMFHDRYSMVKEQERGMKEQMEQQAAGMANAGGQDFAKEQQMMQREMMQKMMVG